MVTGLVIVTWMVVVELTSDETLLLVEVLRLVIEENGAFVEMNVLFGERVVVEEAEEDGVGLGRQEHAEEIRDGDPAQCETNEGRPVVAVLSAVV